MSIHDHVDYCISECTVCGTVETLCVDTLEGDVCVHCWFNQEQGE